MRLLKRFAFFHINVLIEQFGWVVCEDMEDSIGASMFGCLTMNLASSVKEDIFKCEMKPFFECDLSIGGDATTPKIVPIGELGCSTFRCMQKVCTAELRACVADKVCIRLFSSSAESSFKNPPGKSRLLGSLMNCAASTFRTCGNPDDPRSDPKDANLHGQLQKERISLHSFEHKQGYHFADSMRVRHKQRMPVDRAKALCSRHAKCAGFKFTTQGQAWLDYTPNMGHPHNMEFRQYVNGKVPELVSVDDIENASVENPENHNVYLKKPKIQYQQPKELHVEDNVVDDKDIRALVSAINTVGLQLGTVGSEVGEAPIFLRGIPSLHDWTIQMEVKAQRENGQPGTWSCSERT